ncbi:30S ribosomal protein S1 [Armatimonas rosea]|uniref:Ribosomal protein S1 n=1 Tax=Armatimonas rosea TaxID=685828 RepID=A0A7W9SQY3_ARMRO|nr:30S ribosomal protein S1 [Armatimonas rosea]MBB6050369.1 ribosomal protein S1 [Armatimonas rosea]
MNDATPEATIAETSVTTDATEVEQMPPLDEIEVPGGGGDGDFDDSVRELRPGSVVKGTVVHIDSDGILVDVGTKSEGLVRPNEISREPLSREALEAEFPVGSEIRVVVLEEDKHGVIQLSKKRADFEKAWDRVQECLKSGETVMAKVSERVKGGLVVDLGIRGFVPASHVGNGKLKNLDKFVGTEIPLKVLEVDRGARKVVLSNRIATEEEREKQKAETLSNLEEGQVRTGIIRRVTDYGAFVDLGGIDGLLHVSEMSWTRVKHPSDVVKVGQEVQVKILRLGSNEGRVSLGMRQILPDPWESVAEKYRTGDVVEGEVTRPVPFGAFVLLEGGIEGIIPNSELSHRRVARASDVVEAGQIVQVKVVDVRPDERRLTLSLRAMTTREAEPEPRVPAGGGPVAESTGNKKRKKRGRDDDEGGGSGGGGGDYRQYMRSDQFGGLTLGDMFGEMFNKTKAGGKREKRRRVEEEDDDLSDIDGDEPLDVAVADVEEDATEE